MPPVTVFFDELEFAQAHDLGPRTAELPTGPIIDFLFELLDRTLAAPRCLVRRQHELPRYPAPCLRSRPAASSASSRSIRSFPTTSSRPCRSMRATRRRAPGAALRADRLAEVVGNDARALASATGSACSTPCCAARPGSTPAGEKPEPVSREDFVARDLVVFARRIRASTWTAATTSDGPQALSDPGRRRSLIRARVAPSGRVGAAEARRRCALRCRPGAVAAQIPASRLSRLWLPRSLTRTRHATFAHGLRVAGRWRVRCGDRAVGCRPDAHAFEASRAAVNPWRFDEGPLTRARSPADRSGHGPSASGADEPGERSPRTTRRQGVAVQDHTVLFVDDEVNILKALQRLLRNEPIEVLTASTPAEAFELIDRCGAPGGRLRPAHARDERRRFPRRRCASATATSSA